jgi:hypothetical protein
MKKKMLFVAALFAASTTFGQFTSKNGHEVLPEEGDIALGFDAVPVLNFGLNMINIMNNTGQQAQHPGYVSGYNQVIVGKYFLSSEMAVRARLGINTFNSSTKTFGDNPLTPTAAANGTAENILLQTSNVASRGVFIGAGVEMRRGHNRLQGYYGGELFLGFSSMSAKNSYEIEYNGTAVDSAGLSSGASRVLSTSTGTSVTFGLRGFAGVEYFFAPKISVGAEFGWGFGMTTSPRGKNEVEHWGIAPGSTATTDAAYTIETPGNSQGRVMGFGVDNGINALLAPSAALMIHFHF